MMVTTPAIILHSFSYSETSRILRLLTRDHGVQSVIARGARSPKNRFAGLLEVFNEGQASFSLRETRDLHTLTGFDLLRSHRLLGEDLVRFGGASLVAEIVLRVGSEQADKQLYERVNEAFDTIQGTPSEAVEVTVLAEAWSVIGTLGFAPALEECIHCGRTLRPEEEVVFDYTAGGVRCHDCSVGMGGRILPHEARAILRQLASGEPVPLLKSGPYWRLLDRYLAHHVLEGATLKSMEFLAKALASQQAREST